MWKLADHSLWLGHIGDARDLRRILASGIQAIVDLALNEKPVTVTRELVYLHFPLIDGAGNPPWLMRAAVNAVAEFLRSDVRSLVFCSNGMSRSVAIAAAAISLACQMPPVHALSAVKGNGPSDLSPSL